MPSALSRAIAKLRSAAVEVRAAEHIWSNCLLQQAQRWEIISDNPETEPHQGQSPTPVDGCDLIDTLPQIP